MTRSVSLADVVLLKDAVLTKTVRQINFAIVTLASVYRALTVLTIMIVAMTSDVTKGSANPHHAVRTTTAMVAVIALRVVASRH